MWLEHRWAVAGTWLGAWLGVAGTSLGRSGVWLGRGWGRGWGVVGAWLGRGWDGLCRAVSPPFFILTPSAFIST